MPSFEFPRSRTAALTIPDLMVESGAVKSKGEARRLISGGGVYINSERIGEGTTTLSEAHLLERSVLILRTGKKNYHLIKLT